MIESDDFFGQLEHHYKNNLPFVVYRKPNSIEAIAMFQQDIMLYETSSYSESGFVFAPFDDNENAILIPLDKSEVLRHDFKVDPCKCEKPFRENYIYISSKKFHINLVQKGIDAINSNYLKKVVLSRNETLNITETNPIKLFKRLLQSYPVSFVYCWYHPKVGLWLGATPETLLQVEGYQFKTMSLAGTQLYNGTLDVTWEDKEKKEQQLVTEYIVNNLEPLVNSLKISEVKTIKAGKLLHLQTNITGTFNYKQNYKQVLQILHPTPAICGIPREFAKQFILENENYNRDFYTGFMGELNLQEKKSRNINRYNVENNAYTSLKKTSNLYVNLRCMQLKGSTATIYVGGGITKDSIPINEWIETENKTKTIKKVLS